MTKKQFASISLDLDNKWSYQRVHGNADWQRYESYIPLFTERFLQFCERKRLRTTVFLVGRDAAEPGHHSDLRAISRAGHEIGNHSFNHEPWLHLYSDEQLHRELSDAEAAIEAATGVLPTMFRGPGFSVSVRLIEELAERRYQFDASTFPTYIGPLARAYYFLHSTLSKNQKDDRNKLFGTMKDGLRSVKPYIWQAKSAELLEIPVTTMPGFKLPFHLSYLIYLARFSPAVARAYFNTALGLCRLTGTEPSLLLHPLDFLGSDDVSGLEFFPGMDVAWSTKHAWLSSFIDKYCQQFDVVPMGEFATNLRRDGLKQHTLKDI